METEKPPDEVFRMLASGLCIPFTDALLIDIGLLPCPPMPMPSRMMRWRRAMWSRYWAARWRLAEIIAGQRLETGD